MREKFEQIKANYERAKAGLDSTQEYENFTQDLIAVVDDMGWILENWSAPGVMMAAMSIANHARQVEREKVIAVLEFMEAKHTGENCEIRARLGVVAQGAVTGTLAAVVEELRKWE